MAIRSPSLLNEIIKKLRQEKEMTQAQVAEWICASRWYIARVETGLYISYEKADEIIVDWLWFSEKQSRRFLIRIKIESDKLFTETEKKQIYKVLGI